MKKHRVPLYSDNIYSQACFVLFSSPSWSMAWPRGCGCPWHRCSAGSGAAAPGARWFGVMEATGKAGAALPGTPDSSFALQFSALPGFEPCAQGEAAGQGTGLLPGRGQWVPPVAQALGGLVASPQGGQGPTRWHLVSWHSTHMLFTAQTWPDLYSPKGIKIPTRL